MNAHYVSNCRCRYSGVRRRLVKVQVVKVAAAGKKKSTETSEIVKLITVAWCWELISFEVLQFIISHNFLYWPPAHLSCICFTFLPHLFSCFDIIILYVQSKNKCNGLALRPMSHLKGLAVLYALCHFATVHFATFPPCTLHLATAPTSQQTPAPAVLHDSLHPSPISV